MTRTVIFIVASTRFGTTPILDVVGVSDSDVEFWEDVFNEIGSDLYDVMYEHEFKRVWGRMEACGIYHVSVKYYVINEDYSFCKDSIAVRLMRQWPAELVDGVSRDVLEGDGPELEWTSEGLDYIRRR